MGEAGQLAEIAERVKAYLTAKGQQRLEKNLSELLDPRGFRERFDYFCKFVPMEMRSSLLVSGSAIGTEMSVGREYGFQFVCGTEVSADLAALSSVAMQNASNTFTVLYDGLKLPFADSSFSTIASGHILEHTADPHSYLDEHLRVLKSGGIFFLEFPDRYHPQELHCQLVGFEWAPVPARGLLYRTMLQYYEHKSEQKFQFYNLIYKTLKPIGIIDIRTYVASRPQRDVILKHYYIPVKGFVRLLLQKN